MNHTVEGQPVNQAKDKKQSRKMPGYNILLIGFMGTGKSTIASRLSEATGMKVAEMDQIIAGREGMTIPEIFEKYGEEYFRNAETSLLAELQSGTNMVISCGGGVPLRENNLTEMRKNGKVILLTALPETILDRLKDDHSRPLLENNKNAGFIRELMEKRRDRYEAAADMIISTDGKTGLEICAEIMDCLMMEERA